MKEPINRPSTILLVGETLTSCNPTGKPVVTVNRYFDVPLFSAIVPMTSYVDPTTLTYIEVCMFGSASTYNDGFSQTYVLLVIGEI